MIRIETGLPNQMGRLTLCRPEVHNAFNDETIAALTKGIQQLEADASVRSIVLSAEGESFSAGADLNWMKAMASYSEDENRTDAGKLYDLMAALRYCTKPTLARVQGAAYGGGVGLVAACSMAVATPNAAFALTEVKLGLIPAVISPFVLEKIGPANARQLFVTAERIQAAEAYRIGLLNAVVSNETEMDEWINLRTKLISKNAPGAITESQRLIDSVSAGSDDMRTLVSHWIARQRCSTEGQEGMAAFLEKRKPIWPA